MKKSEDFQYVEEGDYVDGEEEKVIDEWATIPQREKLIKKSRGGGRGRGGRGGGYRGDRPRKYEWKGLKYI